MTPERNEPATARPRVNPNLVCAECGAYGAIEIGDTALCETCYIEKGSCCHELERVERAEILTPSTCASSPSDAPRRTFASPACSMPEIED